MRAWRALTLLLAWPLLLANGAGAAAASEVVVSNTREFFFALGNPATKVIYLHNTLVLNGSEAIPVVVSGNVTVSASPERLASGTFVLLDFKALTVLITIAPGSQLTFFSLELTNHFDLVGPLFRIFRQSVGGSLAVRNSIQRRRAGLPLDAAVVNMLSMVRPEGVPGPQNCFKFSNFTYSSTWHPSGPVTVPEAVRQVDLQTIVAPDNSLAFQDLYLGGYYYALWNTTYLAEYVVSPSCLETRTGTECVAQLLQRLDEEEQQQQGRGSNSSVPLATAAGGGEGNDPSNVTTIVVAVVVPTVAVLLAAVVATVLFLRRRNHNSSSNNKHNGSTRQQGMYGDLEAGRRGVGAGPRGDGGGGGGDEDSGCVFLGLDLNPVLPEWVPLPAESDEDAAKAFDNTLHADDSTAELCLSKKGANIQMEEPQRSGPVNSHALCPSTMSVSQSASHEPRFGFDSHSTSQSRDEKSLKVAAAMTATAAGAIKSVSAITSTALCADSSGDGAADSRATSAAAPGIRMTGQPFPSLLRPAALSQGPGAAGVADNGGSTAVGNQGAAAVGPSIAAAEEEAVRVLPPPPPPVSHNEMVAELGAMAQQLRASVQDVPVKLESVIGHGSFGVVYKGTWQGLPVAVKTVVFSASAKHRQRALHEAALCHSIAHPNVIATYCSELQPIGAHMPSESTLADSVALVGGGVAGAAAAAEGVDTVGGASANPTRFMDWRLYIIQEYADGGPLSRLYGSKALWPAPGEVNLPAILGLAHGMARALTHLHSKRIIHGDLSPNNVLLKREVAEPSGYAAKVGDFGLSVMLPQHRAHLSNMRVGTMFYMCPTVVMKGQIGPGADVFSLGVILWELYHGRRAGTHTAQGPRYAASFPAFPPTCPPAYLEVALGCLQRHPVNRPTAAEVAKRLELLLMVKAVETAQKAVEEAVAAAE